MCPGDPLGNHGQRAIALALVFEPLLAHEDGMGVPAPLAHQGRAGLQHSAGVERTNAFLELVRQNPNAALQSAAWAAMGAQLQLIGAPPDDQIATEPQRRSGVIKCSPDTISPSSLARSRFRGRSFRPSLACQRRRENASAGRSKTASRRDAKWPHGTAFAARQTK
jgi:hypothetical protein